MFQSTNLIIDLDAEALEFDLQVVQTYADHFQQCLYSSLLLSLNKIYRKGKVLINNEI